MGNGFLRLFTQLEDGISVYPSIKPARKYLLKTFVLLWLSMLNTLVRLFHIESVSWSLSPFWPGRAKSGFTEYLCSSPRSTVSSSLKGQIHGRGQRVRRQYETLHHYPSPTLPSATVNNYGPAETTVLRHLDACSQLDMLICHQIGRPLRKHRSTCRMSTCSRFPTRTGKRLGGSDLWILKDQ
jgi:hypothetical protein